MSFSTIIGQFHIWQGTSGVLVSNEDSKELGQFNDADAAINWLFLNGHKDKARELNAQYKAHLAKEVI